MSSILFRMAELRSGEGRTVHGTIVPYNEATTVRDFDGEFQEMFAPGAFRRSIAERGHKLKLLVSHDARTRYPVGRAVELREEPHGLFGAFEIADTPDGDEALANVKAGVVDSFSVVSDRSGTVAKGCAGARRSAAVRGFPNRRSGLFGGTNRGGARGSA
ncbi:conserved hypothetical protein [Mycobacterium tuberculosis T17]|nr:conserved hypothetical protein [Mycobacterium tuberculosis T17]